LAVKVILTSFNSVDDLMFSTLSVPVKKSGLTGEKNPRPGAESTMESPTFQASSGLTSSLV